MEVYLILFLILLMLIIGFIFWIYKTYKLYIAKKKRAFWINLSILCILFIFITWELQLFPLSKNFYIKDRCEQLTGKTFWSWKDYSYDEMSVRGEGYTLDIYSFSDEMSAYFKNPDSVFFSYPKINDSDIKWTKTPVSVKEQEILEFVTPVYGGWGNEIIIKQDYIRNIANTEGSYYAYQNTGSTNFYIISPKRRLIILINHNM